MIVAEEIKHLKQLMHKKLLLQKKQWHRHFVKIGSSNLCKYIQHTLKVINTLHLKSLCELRSWSEDEFNSDSTLLTNCGSVEEQVIDLGQDTGHRSCCWVSRAQQQVHLAPGIQSEADAANEPSRFPRPWDARFTWKQKR